MLGTTTIFLTEHLGRQMIETYCLFGRELHVVLRSLRRLRELLLVPLAARQSACHSIASTYYASLPKLLDARRTTVVPKVKSQVRQKRN